LEKFLVIDPSKLNSKEREQLVRIFDEHAKTRLPSIIEQLNTKNLVRRAVDLAILQILQVEGNHEELLDSACASIARTIETLATLMKEGRAEE
jgi:hypothetical protein